MKSMVTDIKVRGDKQIEQIPSVKDKALRINLNENIYGTFAEIGAGQETVRHFFRAGGASGTIAKAMSAYDKDFSDAIYGIENDKRYVTEARLRKMVNHEIGLIAQEVETVLPEFVKEGQDGIKSVNYSQMVSVLIKAVQELSAEVESLKKQLR